MTPTCTAQNICTIAGLFFAKNIGLKPILFHIMPQKGIICCVLGKSISRF